MYLDHHLHPEVFLIYIDYCVWNVLFAYKIDMKQLEFNRFIFM